MSDPIRVGPWRCPKCGAIDDFRATHKERCIMMQVKKVRKNRRRKR